MPKLFIFMGFQRCGTHALSNWLLKQSEDYVPSQLEDVGQGTFSLSRTNNKKVYLHNSQKITVPLNAQRNEIWPTLDLDSDHLICIENGSLFDYEEYQMIKNYFCEHKIIRLIALRDAWNCFASFYKKYNTVDPHIVRGWEYRAEEILGITHHLSNFHFVNYNMWFSSVNYRKELCKEHGLHFTDHGLNDVPNFGDGSSFDQRKLHNQGSKMNVLSRFREFKEDSRFMTKVNPYVRMLSRKIFKYVKWPDE